YEPNLQGVRVSSGGETLQFSTEIINNDIILTLSGNDLVLGDEILVALEAGLSSVKPVLFNGEQHNLVLYELLNEQSVTFVYRGDRPEKIAIDTVLPRRRLLGEPLVLTVSVFGAPVTQERIELFVGGNQFSITSV